MDTTHALIAALRAGDVTSEQLTDEAIARIERDDHVVNAICVPDFDRARAAARHADQARARGEDRPLLGIPVTVKESYDIAGLPTTWGMPEHRDRHPAEDAVQVTRLKQAGAVILGKTNVPLGLQDIQTFNELHGTTRNPWNPDRTPGGSSGGSAAALAAGFGALSLGSDLGGSLRTPAHFCGVHAHKPTIGIAATRGMGAPPAPASPAEHDLAVVGPMARSARDLTLLLDVMAGPDPLTHGKAYALTLPPPRHARISDFRILVLDEHPLVPTSAAVHAAVHKVAEALTNGGARVDRHSPLLPDLTEAATTYLRLLFAGSVARFRIDEEQLRETQLSHHDWLALHARRELHRHGWRQFFAGYDVVLCPITPTPAFPHDHDPDVMRRRIDIDGDQRPYFDQLVWAGLATMPGLPATAIPTGPADGLPVGVQLIGPMFEDRTPLKLAELLEHEIGGFHAPQPRSASNASPVR
ncbi:amidase [Lentzea sp. NBRC 102530]|uniref:amidase n=1 Tax=Lentzea sp. NBRC 102530 TaxID=3032201 RepID=UPI0024A5ED83|nr:amidase [Lentzea sp. NBRC 102530]GLY50022.1 amidase [Lentzea sp. NBRC 102530]